MKLDLWMSINSEKCELHVIGALNVNKLRCEFGNQEYYEYSEEFRSSFSSSSILYQWLLHQGDYQHLKKEKNGNTFLTLS
ncbi:hypothetical protein P8452_22977 [Trifolium repens]|nr:hypothetical protein P8452_22977 [Trifolium repens]